MLSIFEIESLRLLRLRLEMIVKALARNLDQFPSGETAFTRLLTKPWLA